MLGCLFVLVLLGVSSADQGATRFLFLGGDSLLQYKPPSSRFSVWRMEREAVGKCAPFPNLPETTGSITNANKLIFAGGHDILSVDEASKTFELMTCQPGAQNSGGLSCKASVNASTSIFARHLGGSLAYVEPNMLVEYDAKLGDIVVYNMNVEASPEAGGDNTVDPGLPNDCGISASCNIQPSVVSEGSLSTLCNSDATASSSESSSFVVTGTFGAPGTFMVKCKSSTYKRAKLFPITPTTFGIQVIQSWEMKEYDDIIPIGDSLVMGYKQSSLDFEILDCAETECTSMSTGSFVDDLPCSYSTLNTCVRDKRCGFCVETGKCTQTGNNGPCYGQCRKWISQTNNTDLVQPKHEIALPEHQMAYISDEHVLHYSPILGKYEIRKISSVHPSHIWLCPSISQQPVFAGQLSIRNNLVFPFRERSVMFFQPETARYSIWGCKQFSEQPAPENDEIPSAPCSVIANGYLVAARGARNIITVKNLTIVVNNQGVLQMFEQRSQTQQETTTEEPELSENIFFDEPKFIQHVPQLQSHKVMSVGRDFVFDLDATTGRYHVWTLDTQSGVLMGPNSAGQLPTESNYGIVWLGEDRLLAINSESNNYLQLRFDLETIPHSGPLGFITTGRGNLKKQLCTYTSCEDCARDSSCGWCATTEKCLPGNRVAPCEGRCLAWTSGYCSASKTSCSGLLSQEECVSNQACGWCAGPQMCMPQKNGRPMFEQCLGKLMVGMDA